MSFCWNVTLFMWIAQIFEFWLIHVKESPHPTWSNLMASGLKPYSLAVLNAVPGQFCVISRTKRMDSFFRIRRCVLFSSLQILFSTPDPRRYVAGLVTPASEDLLFRAALLASCLRGTFSHVDFDGVCLVSTIVVISDETVVMIFQQKVLT